MAMEILKFENLCSLYALLLKGKTHQIRFHIAVFLLALNSWIFRELTSMGWYVKMHWFEWQRHKVANNSVQWLTISIVQSIENIPVLDHCFYKVVWFVLNEFLCLCDSDFWIIWMQQDVPVTNFPHHCTILERKCAILYRIYHKYWDILSIYQNCPKVEILH